MRRKSGLLSVRVARGLVGQDRYVVRWLKGHPYVYRRQYEGAQGHGRPRLRDVYLGRIPDRLALRGSIEDLSQVAWKLMRRRVRRFLREGGQHARREQTGKHPRRARR